MTDEWPRMNARRHELIGREVAETITPMEALELEHLQRMADDRVRPSLRAGIARVAALLERGAGR